MTASSEVLLADVRALPALPFLEVLDDHGVAGQSLLC